MPLFAYEYQRQWRAARFFDDGKKDLMEQLDWKAGDGCNELDDARIIGIHFERVNPYTMCFIARSIEGG